MRPRLQADGNLNSKIVAGLLRRERSLDFQTANAAKLIGLPAVGVVNGIEITVIYTDVPSHGNIGGRRIISAWRAERHEREAYWKNVR